LVTRTVSRLKTSGSKIDANGNDTLQENMKMLEVHTQLSYSARPKATRFSSGNREVRPRRRGYHRTWGLTQKRSNKLGTPSSSLHQTCVISTCMVARSSTWESDRESMLEAHEVCERRKAQSAVPPVPPRRLPLTNCADALPRSVTKKTQLLELLRNSPFLAYAQ